MANVSLAGRRAKALTAFNNPSSTVYVLIDALESLKNKTKE